MSEDLPDGVFWDRTEMSAARLDLRNGFYMGRPVISRDTQINGGVYVGANSREAIVVDDEKYEDELLEVYNAFKSRLEHKQKGGLMNRLRGQPIRLSSMDLMQSLSETVSEYVPENAQYVNRMIQEHFSGSSNDIKIPINYYIRSKDNKRHGLENNGGVCRHQALIGGYILEKYLKDTNSLGKVSIDRNMVEGKGSHAWVRYTDPPRGGVCERYDVGICW